MNYFKKLRIYIGGFLLKLKIKNTKRTPITCSLSDAKIIGIVFNSNKQEDLKTVRELEAFLVKSNIRMEILGYSKLKSSDSNLIGDKNHHYIYDKDFNWFYTPKNQLINDFTEHSFDILINLYQDEEFAVEYILKISKAKFKVGCAHLDNKMHDLMIDVSHQKDDSAYLSKYLKHYLSLLNK